MGNMRVDPLHRTDLPPVDWIGQKGKIFRWVSSMVIADADLSNANSDKILLHRLEAHLWFRRPLPGSFWDVGHRSLGEQEYAHH